MAAYSNELGNPRKPILQEAEYQSLLARIKHDLFGAPTVQVVDINGEYQDPDVDWLPDLSYATPGSAAIDLRWNGQIYDGNGRASVRYTPAGLQNPGQTLAKIGPTKLVLQPWERVKLGTGLKIHSEDRRVDALVLPRSGLGGKGLVISNLVGLIDWDYQGEWMITVWNATPDEKIIKPGERLVQALFLGLGGIVQPKFEYVEAFGLETERGEGGHGSTGK